MAAFAGFNDARQKQDPAKKIVRMEGTINGALTLELNDSGDASFAVLPLTDVQIERANGDVENVDSRAQRFIYSRQYELDDEKNRIPAVQDEDGEFVNPRRTEPWYDVILPAFIKAGLNPTDPNSIDESLGQTIVLENLVVERRWVDRNGPSDQPQLENEMLRDEEGDFVRVNGKAVSLAEDGTELVWSAGDKSFVLAESGEVTELTPKQVAKTYSGLLPVSIG